MGKLQTVQQLWQSVGGAEQTENSSSSMPFFLLVCHSKQQSVGINEIWEWSLKALDHLNQRSTLIQMVWGF